MKKYNIILLFCALATFFLISCNQENIGTLYSDGGTPQVAFSATTLNTSMIPADSNKIKVAIYRTSTVGTLPSVKIKLYTTTAGYSTGVFSLVDTIISFPAGSNVAYASIKYNSIGGLSATKVYSMGLAIKDKTLDSPSKMDTIAITASRKLTFVDYGTGTFTSTFFADTWAQPVKKAQEGEVYQLIDCYVTGFPLMFAVADDGTVSFATQQTGYVDATYGMVSFAQNTAYTSTKVGKTVKMIGKFTVTAGSFGTFQETMVLP